MTLKEIARLEFMSPESIMEAMELVSRNGDVILIKQDGLRQTNPFTVVITVSKKPEAPIRYDDASLSDAMGKALKDYLSA